MRPNLPSKEKFSPGVSDPAFTEMGKRFQVWLGDDIAKAGGVYRPGPKFSTYDEENIRKVQVLMGDEPDPVGKAYFGPRQWERLFAETPRPRTAAPSAARVMSGPVVPIQEKIEGFAGLRPFKGSAKKIVLHTVEGPKPNWAVLKKGVPHFTLDFDGTVYQHIPLNMAAYTLKGNGNSPNSDAGVSIQIEMAGFAKDSPNRPDAWYANLKRLLLHICNHTGCPYSFPLHFGGQETAGVNGRGRLEWDEYVGTSGILGHQHVPYNDHWDPGELDVTRLR